MHFCQIRLPEILEETHALEQLSGHEIPVFAAGGIWDTKDIQKAMHLGASGVQMATRFIATKECDAFRLQKTPGFPARPHRLMQKAQSCWEPPSDH